MDANVQAVLEVAAPSITERCDVDQSAAAIVSFLIEMSDREPVRMTYCAHHFDRRPATLAAKIVAKTDLRDFGVFDE